MTICVVFDERFDFYGMHSCQDVFLDGLIYVGLFCLFDLFCFMAYCICY